MTYTEAHPEVRQVEADLKALRAEPPTLVELRREEQELVGRLAELASPGKPREVVRALPRRAAPAPVVPGLPAAADLSTREDSPELATAKARLLVSTRRYEDLMDRIDSARIELNTAQAAFKYRYVIVEPPEVPREATRPNGVVLALGGLVLSLLLAIFAASAKDLASGRFVEPWQVRRKLALPILAEVEEP